MSGPIRQLVDTLRIWSEVSGLTMEQVADMQDRVAAMLARHKGSTDAPATFESMTPAKGKH